MTEGELLRRYAFFLFYDPEGYVDEAVMHTLRGLRPHAERVMFISNGYLQDESRRKLQEVADEVFERENVGFDSGAYRSAIGKVGYRTLEEFDEVLLLNYTFLGPITTFDSVFDRMDAKTLDFWGLTDHVAVSPHPILGKGVMPQHLQSYWIAFRRSLVGTEDFRRYWAALPNGMSYHDVIAVFETKLTQHFADLGYAWESAYPSKDFTGQNSSMEYPIELLQAGCPMVKRRIYFHDIVDLDTRGVAAAEVTRELLRMGFPRDVLIDGIIRRTPVRALANGLGLLQVVPECSSTSALGDGATVRTGRFWKSWLRDGQDPFNGSDVVVVDGLTNFEMTDVPEAEAGNQMQLEAARSRARRAILSAASVENGRVWGDARLGMLVPMTEHRASTRLGHGWRGCQAQAQRLAEMLGLAGPLEPHAPLAPHDAIAAYRAAAFATLPERVRAAGGWDALVRAIEADDDVLEFVLDMLAGDIAKTEGYLTAPVTTDADLTVSAQLLEYKFAEVTSRFEMKQRAPFVGRLMHPNAYLRPLIGRAMRATSPKLAKAAVASEAALKKLATGAKSLSARALKRD